MSAKRKSAAPSQKSQSPAPGRRKVDWDAVERDYRTGKFTLRELAEKHGPSHQAIAKRSKVHGWTQDLGEQIKQATNAKLVAKLVDSEIAKGGQAVANTVLAAAEINAQIILKHRQRLQALAEDADRARQKLVAMTEMVADVREAGSLVSAVEAAARTEKILIEQERKAYRIDDEPATPPSNPVADLLAELSSRGSRLPVRGDGQ
jgi:uncharacterized protein YjcR